ncbi:hypothetical protein PI124_g12765 [Phytophthora idaei]|nr:hypothetical protein PI125_g16852 [Phytophthora idaei]KAG3140608.1 hypothetical protein PI126_g15904 [Phytophthora idaei]KAG3242396.1 hypothetical protein PI124_g12765 [Phytophthora idaei]
MTSVCLPAYNVQFLQSLTTNSLQLRVSSPPSRQRESRLVAGNMTSISGLMREAIQKSCLRSERVSEAHMERNQLGQWCCSLVRVDLRGRLKSSAKSVSASRKSGPSVKAPVNLATS